VNTTIFEEDETDSDWLLHLSCSKCKNEWAICMQCKKFKNKMNTNRMICIHRSTSHKRCKRKNNNDDTNIDKNKIQKTDDLISSITMDIIDTDINKTVTINEINLENNLNDDIVKLDETNENNKKNNETDIIQQSSEFEYDVTIGSSVGDEHTLENNTELDNNIVIDNNDETTVTENSVNDDNINNNLNKIIPITLFKEIQESQKIKSMVSICKFVLLLFVFT
jgi:hypothetical protein